MGVCFNKLIVGNFDVLVYMVFVDEGVDNEEMCEYFYCDWNYFLVYFKLLFGLVFYLVGDEEKFDMVMNNIL